MENDPTIVEFKTESVEGPVKVIVDGELAVTLDLKAKPGLLHLVLPSKYRLREVPHTSPRVNEGVHHALLFNHDYIETERLNKELHEAQEQAQALQRLATAYAQGVAPMEDSEAKVSPPVLLEIWDDEAKSWKSGYWKDLEEGMRFRRRDPLSGELLAEGEVGATDMSCTSAAEWSAVEGTWKVEYEACESNYYETDPQGRLLTSTGLVDVDG